MRVTQSMLANANLKYISQNYNKLGRIQNQLITGKRITKPSDDPVIAMNGMRYRSQVVEVEQFQRNLNEGFNWMENSDSALDHSNQVLQRIRELIVQASNDSYEAESRANIEKEIARLQEHLVALANTQVAENYIFNGTDTSNPPVNSNLFNLEFNAFVDELPNNGDQYVISYKGMTFRFDEQATNDTQNNPDGKIVFSSPTNGSMMIDTSTGEISYVYEEEQKYLDGDTITKEEKLQSTDIVISSISAVSTNSQDVTIEVMKGVLIPINVKGENAYSIELFSGLESIRKLITDPEASGDDITKTLSSLDKYINDIVSTRAELGAQINRAEMVESRLLEQKVVATETVSTNEDIDLEEAIINLTVQETIHRASLAVGARIIQPSLIDFLR